jgi:hypothetical protein
MTKNEPLKKLKRIRPTYNNSGGNEGVHYICLSASLFKIREVIHRYHQYYHRYQHYYLYVFLNSDGTTVTI